MPFTRLTDIAEAYATLAERQPTSQERHAWQQAERRNLQSATDLIRACGLHVIATSNPEPYDTAADQAHDLRRRTLQVSTAHCDHPVWSTIGNVSYRILHDAIGHGSAIHPPEFTVAGELIAWYRYLVTATLTTDDVRVAFTETIGQLAYAAVTGDFHPTQPIGFLPFIPQAIILDNR